MSKIERLHKIAKLQNKENELPDYLLEKILNIKAGDDLLMDELIVRVEYFNSEAGMGCFSEGYSVSDIEKTLKKFYV